MRVTIDELRAHAATRPADPRAVCDYAAALAARGEKTAAVEVLRAIQAEAPRYARAFYELGHALAFEACNAIPDPHRAEEAERSLLRATELDPSYARAYLAAAELYEYVLNAPSRAEQMLMRAIQTAPQMPEGYDRLARLCVASKGVESAEAEFCSRIPESTPRARIHYALANGYSRCGRYDLAWDELEKLHAIVPDSVDVSIGFAYTSAVLGDLCRATEYFSEAYRLHPMNEVALVHYLQHLLRIGEREKAQGAVIEARRALAAEPGKLQRLDDFLKQLGLDG